MMLARLYAELLMKVLDKKEEADVSRRIEHFVKLLRTRGHEQLLPRIVREFERTILRARRKADVVLSVAREADRGMFAEKAKQVLSQTGRGNAQLREEVDGSLIRGFSVKGSDFEYDASARRKLLALYETLTA